MCVFFKQKTAYEMRISDWSSDVCSSDLIDAQLLGIDRIKRVFGIDKSRRSTIFLRFGDGVERKRGLARAFRPVNLDHPAARQAADAERDVQPQRAGGDGLHLHGFPRAQLHGRSLAERPVDLRKSGVQRLLTI